MRKPKTLPEMYDSCIAEGYIKEAHKPSQQQLRSLLENATTNSASADLLAKALDNNSKGWMNVYTMYYEALRICAESLLLQAGLKSNNHQCLFAALCTKFPDLELHWDFFEKIRTKRNGINYYGEHITPQDWKTIEVQIKLYISTLKERIQEEL